MANHSRPIVLGRGPRRAELNDFNVLVGGRWPQPTSAVVLLMLDDFVSGVEIARMTGYTVVQVSRLRRRSVAEEGLAGLYYRPRSGRPRSISDRILNRIVALTLKEPGRGRTHWSLPAHLAAEVGVSPSTVHGIWKATTLSLPRRRDLQIHDRSRGQAQYLRDVVGLYLNPPDNAVVLSVDEKTPIQALNRTQPTVPLDLPRRHGRPTITQLTGSTSLYAALTPGTVVALCCPRHTGGRFP